MTITHALGKCQVAELGMLMEEQVFAGRPE